jgi:hypothetical protein
MLIHIYIYIYIYMPVFLAFPAEHFTLVTQKVNAISCLETSLLFISYLDQNPTPHTSTGTNKTWQSLLSLTLKVSYLR